MRSGIYTVGGYLILYYGFILEAKIFLCRNAYGGVFRKDHNAVVAGAYSKFILSADHTEAVYPADLGLLDLEVSGEDGAQACKEDFLPCRHVGSAANHGERLRGAVIHGGDMEVVAVRVRVTGEHLSHNNSLETAFHHFPGFHAVYLYADGGHCLRHLFRGEVTLKILFEPIVT